MTNFHQFDTIWHACFNNFSAEKGERGEAKGERRERGGRGDKKTFRATNCSFLNNNIGSLKAVRVNALLTKVSSMS